MAPWHSLAKSAGEGVIQNELVTRFNPKNNPIRAPWKNAGPVPDVPNAQLDGLQQVYHKK